MHRITLSLVVVTLFACSKKEKAAPPPPPPAADAAVAMADAAVEVDAAPQPQSARATLEARSKSKVKGTVAFRDVPDGVEIVATIEGLTPGDHAFHVHEKGDCSAPDGKSAGDHFNPGGHPHGAPDAEKRHAGDFGNLTADKAGKANKTLVMKGITVADGPNSIVGKAFIVHAKKDDFSQPSGNAGDRVACGVIAAADAAGGAGSAADAGSAGSGSAK